MPASTLDILHTNWERREKLLSDLKHCCSQINAQFHCNGNEVQIHKLYPKSEASLVFEIETKASLDWYYHTYPQSISEPEERVPYFVFNESISRSKLFTIATANCYLDDRLIYDLFKEYLSRNKGKFIYVNKTWWFDWSDLLKLEQTGGYRKDWCFNSK